MIQEKERENMETLKIYDLHILKSIENNWKLEEEIEDYEEQI